MCGIGALDLITVKKLLAPWRSSLSVSQSIYQSVRVRWRMTIAAAFMTSRTSIRTMMPEAAISWKPDWGRVTQLKTWIGMTVKSSVGESARKAMKVSAPIAISGRGLADRAGHGEDVAGQHAAEGIGQDVEADDLPAGRADGVGGLAHGGWERYAGPPGPRR